jgi:hypothetical protein
MAMPINVMINAEIEGRYLKEYYEHRSNNTQDNR